MKNMHSFVIFRLIIFFYILISIHPNNAFSQNRSTGDLINYIASPSSTNNGDGLFGSILNLEVTIYGNNGEFIIKKQDGTKFTSSGLMFLTCSSNGIQVKKDISRQVSFNINFNSCIDDTPMDFYASYEVDSTQVAWVGPIKVTPNKDNCPQFQWIEPNNNSFQFVPFLIKGNAFDLDKIKKVTIAFIDSYGTHYNLTAYNSSPDSAKLYIQNKVDPTFFGLNNGLITIGIYIVDTYDRIGCDSNNQPVSTVDIYWKVGKLEVTPQDSFITSGEKGGNFSPESKYYTLKNTGGTAINFSISNTKNWIDLSLSNGRLEPNASKSLKVSINNYANLLNAGEHNDKIQVKNTTNHIGDTEIPVFLTVNEKPGKLEVTPQETFFSSGEKGGDFSPKSKEYTLKNTGGTAINFSISNTKNWIDLSLSNGRLEPNAITSLKVSINNYANQLDGGEHNDKVQVYNTTNHIGDTEIPVSLAVNEKPGKLEVTPQETFFSSGEKGGDFSPKSKEYTLKNTGGTAINFSISNTKNWIDLSISNGSIEPNARISLKVSINNYANQLDAGEHNDNVQVYNTTNHIGDTEIPVYLAVNEKPGKLEVTPQETFISSGEKGGDFSPKSKEYTLKNTGGTAINFSISNTKNWIDLSISNGSIEPNARTSLKVSINNYANQLDAGEHNDNVQVNNTSNHQGDTQIPVYLTVDEKPGKLEVTPQETFISSGEKGGDFSPKSKEYTLKNTGGIAINISISNTKNWIDLSESNVRLEANSSTSIEVSINNYANQLDVGEHNDKVQVNNLTNHQGDTQITVNLTVNNKINEQTWYKDFDGDGYTDGVRIESTIQLEGYYSQTQLNNILLIDCDDNDPNVNPGAIEVCDNNKDDDCYNGDEQCNNIGGEIHLPVPFIPQVPPGNWTETANCGPVCFLMVDSYHNNSIPTVEDIRMIDDWLLNEFSLPINDYNGSTTTLAQLERLAEEYGEYEQSNVNIHRNWTIDDISNELTEGYPVIVAVRLNMSNVISGSNGHFMVVIGIDENYIYVNDPGRSLESGRGSNMDYDHETFLQSWQTQNNSCLTIHSEIEGGGDSGSGITDVGSGDLPIESDSTSVTNDSNPKSVTPTTTPIDDDNGGGGCFLSTLFSIYID